MEEGEEEKQRGKKCSAFMCLLHRYTLTFDRKMTRCMMYHKLRGALQKVPRKLVFSTASNIFYNDSFALLVTLSFFRLSITTLLFLLKKVRNSFKC